MKRLRLVILAIGTLLAFSAVPAHAQVWGACTGSNANNAICGDKTEAKTIAKRIIDTFLYAVGVLSAIMIIFSGLKYITANGDAEKMKSAKSTLQYSIVGLIVAMLAFTIVNFVVDRFDSTAAQTTTNNYHAGTYLS